MPTKARMAPTRAPRSWSSKARVSAASRQRPRRSAGSGAHPVAPLPAPGLAQRLPKSLAARQLQACAAGCREAQHVPRVQLQQDLRGATRLRSLERARGWRGRDASGPLQAQLPSGQQRCCSDAAAILGSSSGAGPPARRTATAGRAARAAPMACRRPPSRAQCGVCFTGDFAGAGGYQRGYRGSGVAEQCQMGSQRLILRADQSHGPDPPNDAASSLAPRARPHTAARHRPPPSGRRRRDVGPAGQARRGVPSGLPGRAHAAGQGQQRGSAMPPRAAPPRALPRSA